MGIEGEVGRQEGMNNETAAIDKAKLTGFIAADGGGKCADAEVGGEQRQSDKSRNAGDTDEGGTRGREKQADGAAVGGGCLLACFALLCVCWMLDMDFGRQSWLCCLCTRQTLIKSL